MSYSIKKEEVEELKTAYYQVNTKNTFFKKTQKYDCAQYVCDHMDMEELLHHTTWIIPNTNRIYVDYTMLKTYANPSNFDKIVNKFLLLALDCSNTFVEFEVHMNMETFTVSAVERYKYIITMIVEQCFSKQTRYTQQIVAFHLYNIPTVIDQIRPLILPLLEPGMREKFVLHSKSESPELLKRLHQP